MRYAHSVRALNLGHDAHHPFLLNSSVRFEHPESSLCANHARPRLQSLHETTGLQQQQRTLRHDELRQIT